MNTREYADPRETEQPKEQREVVAEQPGSPKRRVRRRTPRPMNIETVQRWVASAILFHVGSVPAITLAVYSIGIADHDFGRGVGLWLMSAVIGLLTAAGIRAIFRRNPLSWWLLLGILPTAVTGFYIF
ncbi:hypothetical protein AB0E69_29300 [Kribbella sp. NPDC026611]|uniref:hypothetical protein n=1 Tax=Kribbella sp. NPDC026611 TaxID=3154911 RepID=UPI0033DE8F86